jgi:hypothetical protein
MDTSLRFKPALRVLLEVGIASLVERRDIAAEVLLPGQRHLVLVLCRKVEERVG